VFYATFNIVSVIYPTFTIGKGGYRRLMIFDTFNNVSVIYRSFDVGKGDQEAHFLCHFQ
jgi:hypothetical protein